jgi:hypothetical protein
VLVAAADIGGNDLEDDAVFSFAVAKRQFWKVDAVNFNHSGAHINNSAIASHVLSCLLRGKIEIGLRATRGYTGAVTAGNYFSR